MNRFALISVGFHALVVTAMTISWPSFDKDLNDDQLVMIDIVDLAEVTNIASASQGAPQDVKTRKKARPKHHRLRRLRLRRQQPEAQPEAAPTKPAPKPQIDDASAEILPDKKTPEVAKPIARPKARPTPPKKPAPKQAPKPAPKKPAPKPKPDLSRINELAKQKPS